MCSALAALSSLVFDIQAQHTHSLRHLFFTENEKEWKLISRWLSFFVETCLRKHATSWDGWDFQEHVLYIVPLIFVGPGHCHRNLGREARALIEKNPEIFLADEEDTADNLFMRTFLEVSPDPVTVCMSFFDEHVPRRMPGIGLRALNLIALFVHCIAREADLTCDSRVFQSLIKAGALSSTTLALRRLSALEVARGISQFDKPTYFSCITRLHGFIICAVYLKALPAIAEAFNLGWLKLLHDAAWFIEREVEFLHKPFMNRIICGFLTKSLIHLFSFPSILRPFVNVLQPPTSITLFKSVLDADPTFTAPSNARKRTEIMAIEKPVEETALSAPLCFPRSVHTVIPTTRPSSNSSAPAKFVNPVGRGSEKEYLELGEVMYHADFPEYCLSGVFDLLGPPTSPNGDDLNSSELKLLATKPRTHILNASQPHPKHKLSRSAGAWHIQPADELRDTFLGANQRVMSGEITGV
ncbi:hypothetical protein BT96DRAFT_977866 [Gymnopus androsaceus JB14]|uniref:Uncharacterized protein n=1 Tax=Gymnopus androsaceus JB14 TaxID=1447944 RepID=A0A6A4HCJ6_9AGAR|nr:hypothetical protein BT96DRAFT_977866 [Gymnopus androsaceus JB14]